MVAIARARTPLTSTQILLRRICRTSPWVHLPAGKGVPPPLAAVRKTTKCRSARAPIDRNSLRRAFDALTAQIDTVINQANLPRKT
jgi:hypothetical protein